MESWRTREDFLGFKPDATTDIITTSSSTALSTAGPISNNQANHCNDASHVEKESEAAEPQRLYPKRVSLTAEDNASLASQTSSAESSEVPEEYAGETASPLKVAEILRQLSQVKTPKAPEAPLLKGPTAVSVENKKTASIEREAFRKRGIPTAFLNEGNGENIHGTKRVRWLPLSHSANAPSAATRFFHNMPQGITGARSLQTPSRQVLPTVPVLKPIPGLEPYDVLVGRDFISHFNLGNRRLLVLAFTHLDKFMGSKSEEQESIVDSLYYTIRSAGGRFVEMVGQRGGFQTLAPLDAKIAIADILRKESDHRRTGMSLMRMFQRDCASIWGSTNMTLNEDMDKKPAAFEDSSDSSDETSTDDQDGPSKKLVKKFEPMTPLAPDFEPGPYDVICSRGSLPKKHPGNIWFVSLVEHNCERYIRAEGKMAKSIIVSEILDIVRKNSPGGGFVKTDDDGRWCETGDHLAREKIGQCFRDRLHTRYSSSSKAKLEKRRNSKCDSSSVGSCDKEDEYD